MTFGPRPAHIVFIFTLLGTSAIQNVRGDDWPHWRGPGRNDVVKESSYYNGGAWLPKEPAWSKGFGRGCTSPIIVAGRMYIMGSDGRRDTVFCLEAGTGKEIWNTSYNCPLYGRNSMGDKGFYAGPSSTPEFDPDTGYLYTLSIDGHLHCWDTKSRGREVWALNLYDKYKQPMRPRVGRSGRRDYGYTSSPLLHGDSIVIEVGSGEGTLMGFDKRSGQRRWTSAAKDPAGHNGGPVPITVDNVPCVAVLHHNGLLVARLDRGSEGKTVATHPWQTSWANNIASPTVHGDHVLLTSGYNFQAMCKLRITLGGAKKIWQNDIFSKVCSPVVHDGHIYWVWRDLYCVDWETGKLRWKHAGSFSDPGSCILTGDDRLIAFAKSGRLVLAETAKRSPKQAKILATRDGLFRQDAWPHVVLADGRLYCKDKSGNVKCFALSPSK